MVHLLASFGVTHSPSAAMSAHIVDVEGAEGKVVTFHEVKDVSSPGSVHKPQYKKTLSAAFLSSGMAVTFKVSTVAYIQHSALCLKDCARSWRPGLFPCSVAFVAMLALLCSLINASICSLIILIYIFQSAGCGVHGDQQSE